VNPTETDIARDFAETNVKGLSIPYSAIQSGDRVPPVDSNWRVAALDDEPLQSQLINELITRSGHTCISFNQGDRLLNAVNHEAFDLFVLDWNVPGEMDGMQTLQALRDQLRMTQPVLMLTSRDNEFDIVAAFKAGADDYVTKPVHGAVLMARLNALIRRHLANSTTSPSLPQEILFDWHFDAMKYQVLIPGDMKLPPTGIHERTTDGESHLVTLTPKAFAIAHLLFRNLGCAVSRDHLIETVWGRGVALGSRTLETHVSTVRSQLGLNAENGFKLSPIYGYGYRLDRTESQLVD
jgi:DNA-binding response OmpR family regulator